MSSKKEILPDLLSHKLELIVCGTAVSRKSSKIQSYYAGRGNKFWSILNETGLTPLELKPQNYRRLTEFGIGLTDLAKKVSGSDKYLNQEDYDRISFRKKTLEYQPGVVGFNGKEAAKIFLSKNKVSYGCQDVQIGDSILFVLPSTSNSANRFWDPNYWHELAKLIKIRQSEK